MKKLINRVQNNTILTIIFALLIGLSVNFLNKYLLKITSSFFELDKNTEGIIYKIYMIISAIIVILIINNGSLKNFGFRKPNKTNYLKMIGITIGITLASMMIGGMLFMGILNTLFPPENTTQFPEPKSIIDMIIRVWIFSSIAEEVFVRGLFQGILDPLKTKKFLRLSLPVILSGLFFGLIHLSLLNSGYGHWFVSTIVFSATVMGLLAAYYREKSESLIPPIIVHFTANVVGFVIPSILMNFMPS